jgi:membrane associated rhomboid family serine protease
VFPVSDDNPTRITPYVTYGIIAANVLVFLYQLTLTPPELENFFYTWAVVPSELTASLAGEAVRYQPFPEWITLITSQFLHGGFAHIAGNMLFLWIFGNNVEERLGHIRFVIFYIGCGVLAAGTQWYFSAGSNIPSLGASGAIAGVMGAYILRFPNASITTIIPPFIFFPFRLPAWAYLGIWFIQQAFYGVASLSVPANIGMQQGGVAYWAHSGGFVFGAVLGTLLGLFSKSEKPYLR